MSAAIRPSAALSRRLQRFEARASDDCVKRDLELTCTACGAHVFDVEHGDELDVLVCVALDHVCGEAAEEEDSNG